MKKLVIAFALIALVVLCLTGVYYNLTKPSRYQEIKVVTPKEASPAVAPAREATLLVPDDYPTIQKAIMSARAGDTVFVKAGVYEESITLKNGVKLVGEGMDKVTLRSKAELKEPVVFFNRRSGFIKGLTIEHIGKDEAKSGPPAILVFNSSAEIVECRVRNATGCGILARDAKSLIVRNCIVESNGLNGIHVVGSDVWPTIKDNVVRSNTLHGIYFGPGCRGKAQGNVSEKNKTGILIEGKGADVEVENNKCLDNEKYGIYILNGAKATATGNICERNKQNGILVYQDETTALLNDNRCVQNKFYGIYFCLGASGVAKNNICEMNGDSGILVSGEGATATLINNQCLSNSNNGIYFGHKGSGTAQDNICNRNASCGITVRYTGMSVEIRNNQCDENAGSGIYFSGRTHGSIEGNVCNNNQWYGISIMDVLSVPTFKGNQCSDNKNSDTYYYEGEFGCVRRMLVEENFDELEQIVHRLRTEKNRYNTGQYQLSSFYYYITEQWEKDGVRQDEWLLGILDRWLKEKPDSPTPLIAKGTVYRNIGWDARGGGFAYKVTKEGWKVFKENLKKAWAVLMIAKELGVKDPELYHILLRTGKGLGIPRDEAEDLFERGLIANHLYHPLYREMADFLQPKWFGSKDDLRKFAERAVELTKNEEGESFYAIIAEIVIPKFNDSVHEDFLKFNLSYPRIKQGYDDILKRYPEADYHLNAYCFIASIYQDKETARELFDKIGDNWNWDAWNYKKHFERCRSWAYEQ